MSIEALTWAFKQPIKPASIKFVFVSLCDYANEDTWRAYPSIQRLCEKTGLNRKTVIRALDRLAEMGYLEETDERVGPTGRVKVYLVTVPKMEPLEIVPKLPPNSPKNGTLNGPKNGTLNPQYNPQETPSSSVPTGTGAEAPPDDLFGGKPPPKQHDTLTEDARSQMWRMGVSLLTNQGLADSTARSLLGKWAKQGEKKLAGVIGECAVKPPADARAYINAAMQNAYNLYDEKQLKAAAKSYGVKVKQTDTWDSLRGRVQDAMRGGVAA